MLDSETFSVPMKLSDPKGKNNIVRIQKPQLGRKQLVALAHSSLPTSRHGFTSAQSCLPKNLEVWIELLYHYQIFGNLALGIFWHDFSNNLPKHVQVSTANNCGGADFKQTCKHAET